MKHEHHHDDATLEELRQALTREFWDERYGGSERVWSGRPNQRLVEQTADLTPGHAARHRLRRGRRRDLARRAGLGRHRARRLPRRARPYGAARDRARRRPPGQGGGVRRAQRPSAAPSPGYAGLRPGLGALHARAARGLRRRLPPARRRRGSRWPAARRRPPPGRRRQRRPPPARTGPPVPARAAAHHAGCRGRLVRRLGGRGRRLAGARAADAGRADAGPGHDRPAAPAQGPGVTFPASPSLS